MKEPIPVTVYRMWDNGHLPVPSNEVRRCELLHLPMVVHLLDRKTKEPVLDYLIRVDQLKDGKRTGIKRKEHFGRFDEYEYEVILFDVTTLQSRNPNPEPVG